MTMMMVVMMVMKLALNNCNWTWTELKENTIVDDKITCSTISVLPVCFCLNLLFATGFHGFYCIGCCQPIVHLFTVHTFHGCGCRVQL